MNHILMISIAMIVILLTGCARWDSSSSVGRTQPLKGPFINDYNFNTPTWVDGGTTLVLGSDYTITYVNSDNTLQTTFAIPEDVRLENAIVYPFEEMVLLAGGYSGESYPGNFGVCKVEGKWILNDGSLWNKTGELIKQFPHYAIIYDKEGNSIHHLPNGEVISDYTMVEQSSVTPVWINEDLIALHNVNYLAFYRISTDTVTVVEDLSDWMETFGKQAIYLGIEKIFPTENGCFYFAHKNEEFMNTNGTLWFADETGFYPINEGEYFDAAFGGKNNGSVMLVNWKMDENNYPVATEAFYILDKAKMVTPLGIVAGMVMPQFDDSNCVVMTQEILFPQGADDNKEYLRYCYLVPSSGQFSSVFVLKEDFDDLLGFSDLKILTVVPEGDNVYPLYLRHSDYTNLYYFNSTTEMPVEIPFGSVDGKLNTNKEGSHFVKVIELYDTGVAKIEIGKLFQR